MNERERYDCGCVGVYVRSRTATKCRSAMSLGGIACWGKRKFRETIGRRRRKIKSCRRALRTANLFFFLDAVHKYAWPPSTQNKSRPIRNNYYFSNSWYCSFGARYMDLSPRRMYQIESSVIIWANSDYVWYHFRWHDRLTWLVYTFKWFFNAGKWRACPPSYNSRLKSCKVHISLTMY